MQDLEQAYARDGYFFPLPVLDTAAALDAGARLAALAASDAARRLGYRHQLNFLHAVSPFVNRLLRQPVLLDAVEALLGPDILLWGSSLFLKPPHSAGHVSWHQDLTYWGLSSEREVAVWIALGPVNRANGCMRFLPGSQRLGQLRHRDTVDRDNILTRGQNAQIEIDEDAVVYVELEPGQASLHHGHLLHASGPNHTGQPRLGLAANFIATSVRQTVAPNDFAMLVRGVDSYRHFEPVPEPAGELDPAGLAVHARILRSQGVALYDGAGNTDSRPAP